MPETWAIVHDYPTYEVSTLGRVRNTETGRILRPRSNGRGYLSVRLYRDKSGRNRTVHRLVMQAFAPTERTDVEICHNNGVKTDNRLSNLRWDTHSQNALDEVRARRNPQIRKTHCPKGHPYDQENTYLAPPKTRATNRQCRICRNPPRSRSL